MGAIQQPTPAMGPYSIEARSESFTMRRAGKTGDTVSHVGTYDDGEVAFPAAEIPQILAALAQATPFAAVAVITEQGAEAEAQIARAWRVRVDGDALRIAGPVWASVEERDDEQLLAFAEIPYGRLAELRELLEDAAGA